MAEDLTKVSERWTWPTFMSAVSLPLSLPLPFPEPRVDKHCESDGLDKKRAARVDNVEKLSFITQGPVTASRAVWKHVNPGKQAFRESLWCTFGSCFDATRPACKAVLLGNPLPIYVYGGDCQIIQACMAIDAALMAESPLVERVDDPEKACVFMKMPNNADGEETGKEFSDLCEFWSFAGAPGRNHILLTPACIEHCDRVSMKVSTGEAIVAHVSHQRGVFRPGFDFVIPQFTTVERFKNFDVENHGRPRDMLVTFRGSILDASLPTLWLRHRYLATTYLHSPSEGVIMDTVCGKEQEYDMSLGSYEDLMLNSRFCFTPGGGGPYSFRFEEALFTCVPVIPFPIFILLDMSYLADFCLSSLSGN